MRYIPVILSFLLLAAHYLRVMQIPYVIAFALMPVFLLVRERWVARGMQLLLLGGAAQWIMTANRIAAERAQNHEPAGRMWVILGAVAAFTAGSALIFQTKAAKQRYVKGERKKPEEWDELE